MRPALTVVVIFAASMLISLGSRSSRMATPVVSAIRLKEWADPLTLTFAFERTIACAFFVRIHKPQQSPQRSIGAASDYLKLFDRAGRKQTGIPELYVPCPVHSAGAYCDRGTQGMRLVSADTEMLADIEKPFASAQRSLHVSCREFPAVVGDSYKHQVAREKRRRWPTRKRGSCVLAMLLSPSARPPSHRVRTAPP